MTAMTEPDMYVTINFEETELRLGLPGAKGSELVQPGGGEVVRKRGFSETVDLMLNLSSSTASEMDGGDDRDGDEEGAMMKNEDEKMVMNSSTKEKLSAAACSNNDPAKPPAAKAQVVGWPPIRSFRKNVMAVQKTNNINDDETSTRNKKPATAAATTATFASPITSAAAAATTSTATPPSAAFVKVSMDGAPYLRKVDLKLYKSYGELSEALGKMFSSFTIGNCGPNGMKDFMSESKLVDLLNGSEYVPSYEDKDGDWMLVGDVPWEMFVESCKRLRIMKGSEAIGLAPRAVEKCKSRS